MDKNRVELSSDDLENVVGGDIGWDKAKSYFGIEDSFGNVLESYTLNTSKWEDFRSLRDTRYVGYGGDLGDEAFRDLLLANGIIH